jgi:hypothetical protein
MLCLEKAIYDFGAIFAALEVASVFLVGLLFLSQIEL